MHLLALEQAAQPGTLTDLAVGGARGHDDGTARVTSDAQLRSAIVNVAGYYLRLSKNRTPAQMEALIWDNTSSDGADHGESCAAFASLTLELAAQAVGQQSWVSGGETYPWPMPDWADVRVDTNPDSPQITSLIADAQHHERWHPLGDGYQPRPGDWAVYDGHVEVVTSYANGVLDSIGADSLPGLTVNAHSSAAPLAEQGVVGFVNNGNLEHSSGAAGSSTRAQAAAPAPKNASAPKKTTAPLKKTASAKESRGASTGATIPGVLATNDLLGGSASGHEGAAAAGTGSASGGGSASGTVATIPGLPTKSAPASSAGSVAIPGAMPAAQPRTKPSAAQPSRSASPATKSPTTKSSPAPAGPAERHHATPSPSSAPSTPGTKNQQAFISLVAPGAMAAQQRYGVPAAVTIAQAIEESAWGQSGLAAQYHNLFGIKGTGPAGSVSLPTSEFEGGRWVTVDAPFRVYHNDAESIADHAELLATSGYYTRAMADRGVPDAFANDLTGVYATDPDYGANLVALMKLYNLYQYDGGGPSSATASPAATPAHSSTPSASATPTPTATASPSPSVSPTVQPSTAPPASSSPASSSPTSSGPASSGRRGAGNGQAGRTGAGRASVPGVPAPGIAPTARATTPAATPATTPAATPATSPATTPAPAMTGTKAVPRRGTAQVPGVATSAGIVTTARFTRVTAAKGPARYHAQLPHAVTTALFASAKAPLARGEHLYRDVAACTDVGWELLAAVDWMQCKADPRYSPVHGEKIGSVNDDATSYPTKSAALIQCASDLVELSAAVYGIDLTVRRRLSVRELAAAFAAFRWGALLRRHNVSPMEFPYSMAGLTVQHQKMHWPAIDAPDAPDRPGGRFRAPFGAVPVVLSLDYPATV
jgi:flagellum-specific peptidoglycan hydrolase FlgJ